MEREQTTIRLPVELKEKLQREANRLGVEFNQLVLLAIDEYSVVSLALYKQNKKEQMNKTICPYLKQE